VIEGLDVANYQGTIQWGPVETSGHHFGIAKAAEATNPDPFFRQNWTGLAEKGILARGAYHFFHPSVNPDAQVRTVHRLVHSMGGFKEHDYMMLDLEVTDGLPPATVIGAAERFVTVAQHSTGAEVVIYTGPWFWEGVLGSPASSILRSCPLHVADYGVTTPPNLGWSVVSFHQYSCTGSIPGIVGAVDLDRFFGTPAQLHEVIGRKAA
jgi:lysozyme